MALGVWKNQQQPDDFRTAGARGCGLRRDSGTRGPATDAQLKARCDDRSFFFFLCGQFGTDTTVNAKDATMSAQAMTMGAFRRSTFRCSRLYYGETLSPAPPGAARSPPCTPHF